MKKLLIALLFLSLQAHEADTESTIDSTEIDEFKTEYQELYFKCWAVKYGYVEIEGFDIKFFREYITFFLQVHGTPAALKLLRDFKLKRIKI